MSVASSHCFASVLTATLCLSCLSSPYGAASANVRIETKGGME
jgi:hypothetical protein